MTPEETILKMLREALVARAKSFCATCAQSEGDDNLHATENCHTVEDRIPA
jgi:hypothetical protein